LDRAQKQEEVKNLHDELNTAKIAVLTRFEGMTVEQMTLLRRNLRLKGCKYKVVKNTLARRAVEGTPFEGIKSFLKQTIGIAYTNDDPVAPAKVIVDFQKNEEIKFSVISAHMDGQELKLPQFKALATLPSREEMLAKMLGSMIAPAQNMVNVLAAIPRQMVTVLAAVRDQKEKQG
jgi:large subunit ribosomal protein L10